MEYININAQEAVTKPGAGSDLQGIRENTAGRTDEAGKSSHVSYESITGYRYDRKRNDPDSTVMNNFEEYIKTRNERNREERLDEESLKEQEKEAAEEIARTISSDEMQRLARMGIDVTSAGFTQIMGIVDSIRLEEHRMKMDRIISKSDEYEPEEPVRNEAKPDMPQNHEKGDSFVMTENELAYIIRNKENLSAESIYKAHFSGCVSNEQDVPGDVFEKVRSQIDNILSQAGLLNNEKALEGAGFLMKNKLPVTTDNIRLYMEYDNTCLDKAIEDVDFNTAAQKDYVNLGEKLSREVMMLNPDMIDYIVEDNREVTIAAIKEYGSYPDKYNYVLSGKKENNLKTLTARRQLEEIRLSMTSSVAARLLKWDINIDTRELSSLVSTLKKLENKAIRGILDKENVEPTEDNINLYQEAAGKIQGIGELNAGAVAAPLGGLTFTVNSLYEWNDKLNEARSEFPKAVATYESVGTSPRGDLGDSIYKAFGNIKDILEEMELPFTEENQRAVRILGYNSMEISKENIEQVGNYDKQVTQLMETFYPESVLSLIKDGVNPLDVPIDRLNRIILSRNNSKGIKDVDNFATYLRDMEKQGAVSREERESYIGIFRVMDKLAKSGDREAGYIFSTGQRLTLRNIISAMRSKKAAGLDISIDERFGFTVFAEKKGKDMEKQIEKGFEVTDGFEVEDKASYIRAAAEADSEIWDYIEEQNIAAAGVNIKAVENMLKNQGGIYDLVYDIVSRLRFRMKDKDEHIDEETENMTDSLRGDEITLPFAPESILESLAGSEEMSMKYDDLRNRLMELMYSSGVSRSLTGMDISAIKTAAAGLGILSTQAKSSKYSIPVSTGEGIRIVNLSIREEGAGAGLIEISMDGGEYGRIRGRLELRAGEEMSPEGYIVSDTGEGNYYLDKKADELTGALKKDGYETAYMSIGKMPLNTDHLKDVPADVGNKKVENVKLYNLSVIVIKAISGMMNEDIKG